MPLSRSVSSRDHLLHLPGVAEVHPGIPGTAQICTVQVKDAGAELERSLLGAVDMLGASGHRATFFVCASVAEARPNIVKRIRQSGHEVAVLGPIRATPAIAGAKAFRAAIHDAKSALETITGEPVLGYRAADFSLVPNLEWALDLLLEEGYLYDSSLVPVRRREYGHGGVVAVPHWIVRIGGKILEVPPATVGIGGLRMLAGGGTQLRSFPYPLFAAPFRRSARSGRASVLHIGLEDLCGAGADSDAPLPPGAGSAHRRLRTSMVKLLGEFRFTSIAAAFGPELALREEEVATA